MTRKRVAVTGIGVVCSIGNDVDEFWRSLRDGRSGIGELRSLENPRLSIKVAAEVRDFRPADHFSRLELEFYDRFAQFAVVATRQAVADAHVEWSDGLQEETAISFGTNQGGQLSYEAETERACSGKRPRPLTIVRTMLHSAAAAISIEQGIRGPSMSFSSVCASSTLAIGWAFRMIRDGYAKLAIAGGSEAPLSPYHLMAWEGLGVLAPDTCRPFSKGRRGLVMGEGAAVFVLRPLEEAESRGDRIYAEVMGLGMSSDGFHMTRPSGLGAARAMQAALNDADLAPEQIGYINAHGSGTPTNDPIECRAIRKVFGGHAEKLAISSTKSMHGHALGAAGAIQAAATVLSLKNDTLPPTVNFIEPDPECDLDVVPNASRAATPEAALSNSFGFGGVNAVLAFRRHRN